MTWAIENKGYSQRRACGLVGMEPRVYRYRPSRPEDAGLRKRLRELAAQRRCFGFRRLHLLPKREGVAVNWKKLYRLYREERLTVRKRGGRKQALATRAAAMLTLTAFSKPMIVPTLPATVKRLMLPGDHLDCSPDHVAAGAGRRSDPTTRRATAK